MNKFGRAIKEIRTGKSLPLRTVAAFLDIDQAILSKIENGHRKPPREIVVKLADYYNVPDKELLLLWLTDKITYEIQDEDLSLEALKLAEEEVIYHNKKDLPQYRILTQDWVINTIRDYLQTQDKVNKAWLFGSYARGDADAKSDIDLLIDVRPDSKFTLFDLAEIQYQLENQFHKKVDVVSAGTTHPMVTKHIDKYKLLIYENQNTIR